VSEEAWVEGQVLEIALLCGAIGKGQGGEKESSWGEEVEGRGLLDLDLLRSRMDCNGKTFVFVRIMRT
jgi:hypothetical protein